ncbi:tetratricopeptide repeat protein [Reyranella sp. CPCC 100927]|uniref:tetratricopeptide repeat protein n=1 Tax=Reyranella sp. CPCC 100927 TaxID=2599616 RepID=UPI0015B575D1|nr:tetratricopeptide repeat protein [Reyranella sp. CPCC 100927]
MSQSVIERHARRVWKEWYPLAAARASWLQVLLGCSCAVVVLAAAISSASSLPQPQPADGAAPAGAWRDDADKAWIAVHAGTFKIRNARLEGRALAVAHYERGNAYRAMRDHYSALADYTAAVGADPAFAEAYVMRGLMHQATGHVDKGIADYDAAIGINPDLAVAYFNRAIAHHGQGRLQDAVTDFARAAKRGHVAARDALLELGAPAQAER